MGDKPEELVNVPQDLTLVSDAELETYGNQAVTEFDRINALDDVTSDTITYGLRLADDIDRVRAEVAARNADVARLTEELAAASTNGRPVHVTVLTDDSTEHEFVPAT